MVSPAERIDPRASAELAQAADQGFIQQAACFEAGDQRLVGPVVAGSDALPEFCKAAEAAAAVHIPAERVPGPIRGVYGYEEGSVFNELSCREQVVSDRAQAESLALGLAES